MRAKAASASPTASGGRRSARAPRRSILGGGLATAVAVLFASGGCASRQRKDAKKLLEAIAKAGRRQSIARKQFIDIASARLQESTATTDDDVAAGLAKLKAECEAIREESQDWPIPTTMEAESLMIACRRALESRGKLLEDFEKPFLETLRNAVLPPPQKAQKAARLLEGMTGADDALSLDLRRAQRAYAASMGIFSYE